MIDGERHFTFAELPAGHYRVEIRPGHPRFMISKTVVLEVHDVKTADMQISLSGARKNIRVLRVEAQQQGGFDVASRITR